MIKLENVSFKKGNKSILKNINLEFMDNRLYAITGPNGSGKSTLAKLIMGIEKPTEGKIYFNDIDITNLSINERAKLKISYAFQQPITFKGITIHDLLKIAIKKEIDKKEACEYLSKVGLCAKEYIDREINNTLSGGELKRVEIASVIATKPKIAIFDEPEAGIDLWSFQKLINVFKYLKEDMRGTNIIITHQEKILNMAEEIILMETGKIINVGKKDEILNKARFLYKLYINKNLASNVSNRCCNFPLLEEKCKEYNTITV